MPRARRRWGKVTPVTGGSRRREPLIFAPAERYIVVMRVLCIGRHQFLSEHLCRFFESLGLETIACVGIREAANLVPMHEPDAVICDYDLLATISLADWERDPALGRLPVIAVSLTRHPGEAHLLDINGIAGFLYLPTLDRDDAQRLLAAIRPTRARIDPPNVLPWPGTTPVAQFR
jgi:DNA-binding NarL/FixJ family response regulator